LEKRAKKEEPDEERQKSKEIQEELEDFVLSSKESTQKGVFDNGVVSLKLIAVSGDTK